MLRKIRGYDVCATSTGVGTNAGPDLMYDLLNGFSWYNGSPCVTTGKPGPSGSGPNGQCAFKIGHGMFTDVFDPQSDWFVGMDWQHNGANVTNKWLYLSTASVVVIGIESESTGKISIVTGGTGVSGSGVVIATTTIAFPASVWTGYLEFTVTGFGGTATYELWQSDPNTYVETRLLTGTVTLTDVPDRVTHGNNGGDTRFFDNEYICDGQGASPWNGRLGPCRVTALSPTADVSGAWNAIPTGAKYLKVQDLPADPSGSPDGDSSIITPNALGAQQLFNVLTSPCYGRVLGLAVNMCFRGTSGSAAVQALMKQTGAASVIGTPTVTGTYHTAQAIAQTSPATGGFFTDAEISNALWGVSTLTSLDARVTQVFLEKLTSLRSTPYSCGAGSYSY